MASKIFKTSNACVAAAVLSAALCSLPSHAGNGRFRGGVYNFCVSVRFNATPGQLAQIRTAFQNASQIFADATDGQQRFGTVTIINDSGGSQSADFWVNSGTGRAFATIGQYGVRGQHVNLFFNSNFQALNGSDGDAYTIAHEHSHHAFGVLDEYSGPGPGGTVVNAECASPPPPADAATLNFCLMDNYFTRGGNAGFGTYTLNEYCVAANHDTANATGVGANNTFQQSVNGQSCWATIAAHPRRAATAPAGLPADPAPAGHVVTLRDGFAGLRVVLVLDRSGSMALPSPTVGQSRLFLAKAAADQFVDLLNVGDDVGVVTFDDTITTPFSLTTIAGAATQVAAKAAIDGQVPGGATDIGDALARARDMITARSPRSCNEVIVLCTDGDWNTGTPPLNVLPSILDEGITVFTVGTGFDISNGDHGKGLLQDIADQTGGKFYFVPDPAGLPGIFAQVLAETAGSGLLTRSPGAIGPRGQIQVSQLLETGILRADFLLNFGNPNNKLTLTLIDPLNATITPRDATNENKAVFFTENAIQGYIIRDPIPGIWKSIVSAPADLPNAATAPFQVITLVTHDGVQLNAVARKPQVAIGDVIEIEASPVFTGAAVPGAQVSGDVVKPDGSREPISLFDDGSALHADAVANDGIYSTRYGAVTMAGVYAFELNMVNTTGQTYAGEDLFTSVGAPSSTKTNTPAYVRLSTASVVVTSTSAPEIRIEKSPDGGIIISWSPDTPDTVLQSTLRLAPADWTNVPVLINPTRLPASGTNQFFRVYRPQ